MSKLIIKHGSVITETTEIESTVDLDLAMRRYGRPITIDVEESEDKKTVKTIAFLYPEKKGN